MSLLRKRRCPECGCGDPDPCNCGCPCGTEGGLISCDGRTVFPIDSELSFTSVSGETDMWVNGYGMGPGSYGYGVYGSQWAIDQVIAETDPGDPDIDDDVAANWHKLNLKVKSKWEVVGSSYSLTDNTSVGCETGHFGILVKYKSLNGDTYVFDTLAGLPRLKNTVSLLDNIRQSGNDFEGNVFESNYSPFSYHPINLGGETFYIENHTFLDIALFDEADWNKRFETTASVDSRGNASFFTRVHFYTPMNSGGNGATSPSLIRFTYKNEFYRQRFERPEPNEYQSENHHYKWIGPMCFHPGPEGGHHPISAWDSARTQSGEPGEPQPAVCVDDVETEYVDPFTDSFTFVPGSEDTPTGEFISHTSGVYFTASTYVNRDPAYSDYNFITGMESTATVGTRSNPGGIDCDRCFDAVLKITDGDTSVERIIWQGQIRQLVNPRLVLGEDPENAGWTHLPIWVSEPGGAYGEVRFYLARAGKEHWRGTLFTGTTFQGIPYGQPYEFKGGDCPGTITEGLAEVGEIFYTTSTGDGTPASPQITHRLSRLKVDVVELVLSSMACDPCLEDPCEEPCAPCEPPTLFNSGESQTMGSDNKWKRETSPGSGTTIAASIYTGELDGLDYVPSGADADYIAQDAVGTGWLGELYFEYDLELDCVPEEGVSGVISTDNQCTALEVNGVIIDTDLNLISDSFLAYHPFNIPASALGIGSNIIRFYVMENEFNGAFLGKWDD